MAKKRIQRTDQIFAESEAVTALFAERERAVQRPIPVESLVPNRFNPRQIYSKEGLDELTRSMEEHGFIGALDGRELPDGRVELAYGSRRLLAAKRAGIQAIPVFLHDWDDTQLRFVTVVENLIREDLTPVEEAETIGQMNEGLNFSVREIARKTGKPKSWVEDRLALYRAPQDVQELVSVRNDALRAANYISRVSEEEDRRILEEKVIQEELTTRQIQQAVQYLVDEDASVEKALATVVTAEEKPTPSPPSSPSAREPTRADTQTQQTDRQVEEQSASTEDAAVSLAAEVRSETPLPSTPSSVSVPEDDEDKTTERTKETKTQLVPGDVSQSIIEAKSALGRFDIETVRDDEEELNKLRNHLMQLIERATHLLDEVDTRLQGR